LLETCVGQRGYWGLTDKDINSERARSVAIDEMCSSLIARW
jgi:hypothetical protein